MDETTVQTGTPTPEPQRAGNLILGPAEPREPRGPTFQDRIAEARRLMEAGENPLAAFQRQEMPSATPEPQPAAQGTPAEPGEAPAPEAAPLPEGFVREADGRIRGPGGRFYTEEQARAFGSTPAEGQAEAQAGEPAAEDAQEAEAEAEPEQAAEPEEELVTARLPGRRPEDPDEEYQVPRALAESINRLRNGYMRREEFQRQMAEVQQARSELDAIEARLRVDPENFLIEHIPAERRASVVRHLLADEQVWNAVVEELAAWDRNETERRAAWATLEAQRLRQSRTAEQQIAQLQAVQQNALEIREAIRALVPDEMDPQRAQVFLRYAVGDLSQYVNQNGIQRLDPAEVPVLLYRLGTLQAFGIEPTPPASPGTTGHPNGGQPAAAQPRPTDRPAARSSGPAVATVATAAPAPDPGAQFKAQAERRAAAAAVAPAGVGAAPARIRPPEGQTVEERIKWARENLRR